ncbi:MAG: hypothetical protein Q7S27_03545 [Nanoarchaeota archaeon]|nr:hypothetical protein [Nanoarchaeota archaeon]
MLNTHLFNPKKIAEELYNPENIGVLSINNFIDERVRQNLLEEISRANYRKAQSQYGNANQEFFYFEPDKEDRIFPITSLLKLSYLIPYNKLAQKANFQKTKTEVFVQKYRKSSLGITPHKDNLAYRNLISIFILQGEGDFYVCSDREKTNPVKIDSPQGSVILMRAPRNIGEKNLRPMHYVENIRRERHVITLREKILS